MNYEINLFEIPNGNVINDICYYDQKASVYNLDPNTKVFYYLIPSKHIFFNKSKLIVDSMHLIR
jgi:hypothetical protein